MTDKEMPDALELYKRGIACSITKKPDLIEAHKWFNLSAMMGMKEALLNRAEVALEMTNEEVAKAQKNAREYIAEVKRNKNKSEIA